MFPPSHSQNAIAGGLRRREWLRIGGLSALGISLQGLGSGRASAAQSAADKGASFGRAKSCILFFLSGGPPQHDTFDPKPDAPLEVRGTFRPIATSVPGLNFCETLPETARVADRLAVIRSMTTDINAHSTSGAFMLTGYLPSSKAENVPAGPQDWPSIASVVGTLKPSVRSPLSSVVLPELIHNNGNIVWPGQNGGFMGAAWHPMMIQCDPMQQPMRIEGMSLTDGVTSVRLAERFDLLQQFDAHFRENAQSEAMALLDRMHHKAFDVLHSDASRRAFEIERESSALRDNYGRHKLGQSVLLARRLVEAGVRLVQVNWPRASGDENIGNPLWDTHQNNAARVRDVLCPQFDRTFATLIADLEARGLLDETLVVVMGEFGRSPKINAAGGRDHWGSCFSVVLAGAGVGGGQIVGASDRLGAFPASRPVTPPDLAATIFHLLGLDPASEFIDPLGRPRRLTDNGQPLRELIGA
ncbi:MAG: DUF1501 domain-containing protein [Chthoniobacter sp.]|nr:DUF1501 domain-containing protein [Chthoniobacter sp.]